METELSPLGEDLLSHYGAPIAHYRGEGILTVTGGQAVRCRFEGGQLATGDVLLLCGFLLPFPSIPNLLSMSAHRLQGTTREGFAITASRGISETNYLPEIARYASGWWMAFQVREMRVQMGDPVYARRAHFGVTNLQFTGTAFGNQHRLVLPLILERGTRARQVWIVPVVDYDRTMNRVQTLKTIDVTCEVVADITGDKGIARLERQVGDLCYLLSVARGTKIQWVYRDLYNGAGQRVERVHTSRVTRPYCPLAVVDPRPRAALETKDFVERAYPVYTQRRRHYKLSSGLIDAYLGGKAEHDYIEARGVKLAVAIEALRSLFVAMPDSPAKELILESRQFKALVPSITHGVDEALKAASVPEFHRQAIRAEGKVQALNRRSFRYILKELCRHLGLPPKGNELELFVACRNSLVHTGRFYCKMATAEQRRACKPRRSPLEEYLFVVAFLDRVFLRLLGYSGPYCDWSRPGGPVRKVLRSPPRADDPADAPTAQEPAGDEDCS